MFSCIGCFTLATTQTHLRLTQYYENLHFFYLIISEPSLTIFLMCFNQALPVHKEVPAGALADCASCCGYEHKVHTHVIGERKKPSMGRH